MPEPNYDIKTLQDYLAGKLDAKAMHALEKQALEDPLLAEALEGLEGHPGLQPEDLDLTMQRLHNRLDLRVSEATEEEKTALEHQQPGADADPDNYIPVKSLYGSGAIKKWVSAAAIVLILLGGGWLYFAMQRTAPSRMQKGARYDAHFDAHYDKEIAGAVTEALTDSVPGSQNEDLARQSGKMGARAAEAEKNNALDSQVQATAGRDSHSGQQNPAGKQAHKTAPEAQNNLSGQIAIAKPEAPVSARLQQFRSMQDTVRSYRVSETNAKDAASQGTGYLPFAVGDSIPGLRLSRGAAVSEGQHSIRIRGAGALQGKGLADSLTPDNNTGPLFVIDGIPVTDRGRVDALDPAMIDSMAVLKGEQATAIYGARGVNGVVLISTKRKVAAAKPLNNETASLTGPQVVRKKISTLQGQGQENISAGLEGQLENAAVNKALANKSVLQAHVRRLNGYLQPNGGFPALEKYLDRQLAEALKNQEVSVLDTGKIYFEVRLEDPKAERKAPRIQLISKQNSNKSLESWVNKVIRQGPEWIISSDYRGEGGSAAARILISVSGAR